MRDTLERARKIRLLIFDVDGVLTDGSLYLGDDGQEYKAFHSRDGHGMKMLQRAGIRVAIVTSRSSNVVRKRMDSLGIEHVFQGRHEKLPAYQEIKEILGLQDEQIAYVGDDVLDLPIMRRVGLAIAVADAHPLVHRYSHWQTQSPGGKGAGREACELIMDAQGKLDAMMESYL
jgi:3-deoxy-D-manno-octulosonate 8-phosphate phosphatase (KDO 8-P phosphatase)